MNATIQVTLDSELVEALKQTTEQQGTNSVQEYVI